MKREARILLEKAVGSLVLGIEMFNRPSDWARTESVLIFLDHSFEMLLKAAIVQRGGRIRVKGNPHTVGFEHCVGVCLSDGKVRFLSKEDAVVIRSLNSLRDAAQHYFIDVSEQQLYIHAQGALTIFRTIMKDVLEQDLAVELPDRVLPLSTTPPVDLTTMFDLEIDEVKKLLQPGRRQRLEAMARLRALAIVHNALEGKTDQPSIAELDKLRNSVLKGKGLGELFPGITTLNITTSGVGPAIELRISKTEGIPVQLVGEGAASGTPVIAIKRVDELGFYNLGRDDLAGKVGLTGMKTTALIWYLKLRSDSDCCKEVNIGKSHFLRYSQNAITKIKEALQTVNMDKVWESYSKGKKAVAKAAQPAKKAAKKAVR